MLDSRCPASSSHWYVIRAHHREEARAEANLSMGKIETFLPWVRAESRSRKPPCREPLFPQYLFARFDPDVSLHDVTFTRGVQSLVRFGGQLGTLDDEVIEFFRSRVDEHGVIPIAQELPPGGCVTIRRGPFAELAGVVERGVPSRHRVVVLLNSVCSPMRIEVLADDLR
jgi:transcriptional antiterminator RfaH